MKKFTLLIAILLLGVASLFAQAPEKFNYQAVVRNASNALVTNAPVGVRVSILQGSAAGNAVYVETHTVTTNANGLMTVEIGGGTVQQGTFAGIDWANGPFFLKTETDPAGGASYSVTSTQQLMSVPYALYAGEAANGFSGDYNDLTNRPQIPQNISQLTNDANYVTLDQVPAQVNADWNATEGLAEILNKPTNAYFGQGIVRNKVDNPAGATDITVNFSSYSLMSGGVVSLAFTRAVPAGATLNINEMGAKPIYYHESALPAGTIKANDRCLFMYNSASGGRYYLIAIDRWGVDLDALATVAHTGSYNDLTDKPTNLSSFVNDMGYITAIPDSFGGISIESDPIFSAWDKDYNDLINKPELFSGDYNDLTNLPTNATFGQGIVKSKVNNPAGATDITVTFSNYQLVSGGVVSLAFTRAVPEGATLNINNMGAKPIYFHEAVLPAGTIKANDRCLFMYNSASDGRYYLIAIDRWGVDLDALATVAHTGSYNDLTDKPTIPTIPTNVSAFVNDMGYLTTIPDSLGGGITSESDPVFTAWDKDYNDLTNKPTNSDFGQGIVRNKVNNPSGDTNIVVNFSTYSLVNGGVVSLAFTRGVPAGSTLNINNMGAKPIFYHESPLPAGLIKANDRCLFMYNGPAGRYYLLAIDRWGADLNALAAVATSGNYNDLTNKPVNVSAFTNDAGYLTQSTLPAQVNADWNATSGAAKILNKPNLATVATSGDYNDLNNKPANADFGQGIVKNKVNNPSGATDIVVSFPNYQLVTGGVVSLAFTRAVPAGATLNINDMGAKPIYYHEAALPAGLIKANDRCLFMYNSASDGRYYLIAIDRWGADLNALAAVATSGNYNDLTNKPTIPTQLSQLDNNVGFITASDVPTQQNADWNATSGVAQILHKPNLATVATTGNYNDLTNKPTGLSQFTNDMGYLTAIPDGMGGISVESDPIFSAWDKNYNDLTNKPTNATFGQGIVKNKVDNPSGATDITVSFSSYELVSGGVVSLVFTRAVPAGATLNINNKGAKPIYYHEAALPAGLIKANDRCLFMYNSGAGRYYLLANDRWGADFDALATVAHTGSYNDLVDKPNLATVATSGNYNDLTGTPEIPTVNNGKLTIKQNGSTLGTFTANQSTNKTVDITAPSLADVQALINSSLEPLQQQNDALQDQIDNMNFVCGTSTVKDYDGNEYNTVKIGNQCWTKENMRAEHYSDGTAIPDGGTNSSETVGYRYDYTSSSIPFEQRGYLYNWPAAMHGAVSSNANPSGVQGICPVGWHVPSDAEWTQLTDYVGSQSAYTCGGNSSYIAKALASTTYWNSGIPTCVVGNTQSNNNATGFSALPAGYGTGSSFNYSGNLALFWSSTEASGGDAWYRCLDYYDATVYRNSYNENYGFSVRCLRDNMSVADQLNSASEQIAAQQAELDNVNFVCGTSTVKDYDGNEYNTVKIGNQCWTKENMRAEHYSDGTAIPDGGTNSSETVGYRYDYTSSTIPFEQRGYLYNWPAAMHGAASSAANPSGVQGVCPVGWHVPSNAEWTQLTDYVSSQSAYTCGGNSSYIAKALASTTGWESSTSTCAVGNTPDDNNATGFSALPAGNLNGSSFYNSGSYAVFWSSTEYSSSSAYNRCLYYNTASVSSGTNGKRYGYSVRCLRDNMSVADQLNSASEQLAAQQAELDNLTSAYTCEHDGVVDVDGNVYGAVMIGNQCWMKENLRTTHYSDGTAITSGGSNSSETVGYYYNYSSSSIPLAQRGYLYNWPAVMHGASSSSANPSGVQGICPTGWHVPSDAEWTQLTDYVSSQSEYLCNPDDHTTIARALCAPDYWNSVADSYNYPCYPGTDYSRNNATGFSALPAGRHYGSSFYNSGNYAYFWSSTEYSSSTVYYRSLYYSNAYVYSNDYYKSSGYSVRCLRD